MPRHPPLVPLDGTSTRAPYAIGDGQKLTLEDRKALTDLLAHYSQPDSEQEEGF